MREFFDLDLPEEKERVVVAQSRSVLNTLWQDLTRSRAFWLTYLSAGVDFAGCSSLDDDESLVARPPSAGAIVTFSFPDDFDLRFTIHFGEHSLELLHPDFENPLLVGTMDSHQMSDAFRWSEFDAITRYLNGALPDGPSWAHELALSSYVGVTPDCVEAHLSVSRRSLAASDLFAADEIEHVVRHTRRFAVRKHLTWSHREDIGWFAEGDDAYSMRHAGRGFDFESLRRFLEAVPGAA